MNDRCSENAACDHRNAFRSNWPKKVFQSDDLSSPQKVERCPQHLLPGLRSRAAPRLARAVRTKLELPQRTTAFGAGGRATTPGSIASAQPLTCSVNERRSSSKSPLADAPTPRPHQAHIAHTTPRRCINHGRPAGLDRAISLPILGSGDRPFCPTWCRISERACPRVDRAVPIYLRLQDDQCCDTL
jgi:hypothetical protein